MDLQKENHLLEQFEKTKTFKRFFSTLLRFDEELDCFIATEKWRDKEAELLTAAWWMFAEVSTAQAVPEGRTDFEIINQTIELVDLLALSTNVFQRDPKSKVHPFESENPRVMEWWRTACQIQELLTNTDPDNCDFEEYKAMIEAQEQSHECQNP